MITIRKYYKNSNTGDLIMSQEFTCDKIKNIPIYWYRNHLCIGENIELPKGYVPISERKYLRELKFLKNKTVNCNI